MKKNFVIISAIGLVFIAQPAVSGTNEVSMGYTHGQGEIKASYSNVTPDYKSDAYLATYSYYSTNLADSLYPELAILNSHPSVFHIGYGFAKAKFEYAPDLKFEYKNYQADGRYAFANGLGLGGGMAYAENFQSSNFDAKEYDIYVSVDYQTSEQSNVALELHRNSKDSEDDPEDSDGYAVELDMEMAFNNLFIVSPFAEYSETDNEGQNVTDHKRYSLGIMLGVLFNEKFTFFVGGLLGKSEDDDNTDSDTYVVFIRPSYWVSKNFNISFLLDYNEIKSDLGQNNHWESKGYVGDLSLAYRF